MNFYIGNSIDEIEEQDTNIEFSDDLIDFIYKFRRKMLYDARKLYHINPYSDVEISKNDLPQIIEICEYILDASLLQNYQDLEEGEQMLKNLIEISQKAITENSGLISIGD